MKRRSISIWLLLLPVISGCASMDCCNWFGRNTDGSTNMGRKPTPVQAGPIAGTYTKPGAGTVTPTMNGNATSTPPVIISSPAQSAPPSMPNSASSPLLTPPSMPSDVSAPGAMRSQGTFNQLPPAELTNTGSSSPVLAPPTISAPSVNTKSIDLTLPGSTSQAPSTATPMLLVPVTSQSPGAGASLQVPPPVIEMPAVAAPQINGPAIQAAPKPSNTVNQTGMNPGTVPPPLPPPPAIPVLGGK